MTRRSGGGRTTKPERAVPGKAKRYPSLRERSPFAYWLAIFGVFALVLSTIASVLSAIL